MDPLDGHLKHKTYQTIGYDLISGIQDLFNTAADLCEKNPQFQSSLIVVLFKAAVTKEKIGANAKTEERVVNFFPFIQTYDPNAASVLSANIGGPYKYLMKTLDAHDQKDCILDCGKDGEKVIKRAVAAIECRSANGVS
eukprot:11634313-Ditylum_brightwellii.AAC.1